MANKKYIFDTNILIRISKEYKQKVDEEAKKYGGTSEFTRKLYDEYFNRIYAAVPEEVNIAERPKVERK